MVKEIAFDVVGRKIDEGYAGDGDGEGEEACQNLPADEGEECDEVGDGDDGGEAGEGGEELLSGIAWRVAPDCEECDVEGDEREGDAEEAEERVEAVFFGEENDGDEESVGGEYEGGGDEVIGDFVVIEEEAKGCDEEGGGEERDGSPDSGSVGRFAVEEEKDGWEAAEDPCGDDFSEAF